MLLIFRDGPVFTGEGRPSRRSSVAVRGERIVAVGPAALELLGEADEVIDLGDRLLMPGFQDAHVHPVQGGLNTMATTERLAAITPIRPATRRG